MNTEKTANMDQQDWENYWNDIQSHWDSVENPTVQLSHVESQDLDSILNLIRTLRTHGHIIFELTKTSDRAKNIVSTDKSFAVFMTISENINRGIIILRGKIEALKQMSFPDSRVDNLHNLAHRAIMDVLYAQDVANRALNKYFYF